MDYDQLDVVLRADSEERNPDVLRAEMSVLTTQSSVQFSADAYAAIQNVQTQCAADLKSMCSSEQIKLENRLVDDKLMTRRLSEQGSGMQMIKAIQSLYRHNSDNLINPSFVPRFLREKSKTSLKTVKDASADTAAAPSALAFPSAGVPRSSGGMKSLNLSPGPVIKKVNDVSADSGAADGAAPAGGPRGGPMAGGRGAGGRGFGSGRGGGRMAGGRGGFGGRGSEAAAESVGLAALENTDAAVAAESNGGTFVPVGGRGAGRGGAANGRGMGRMGGRGQQPNQKQQPPQAQQQQLPPQMQPVPQQALPLTQSNVPSAAMPTTKGGSGSLVPQQQQTNGEGVVGAIKSIFVPGTTSTAAAPAVGAAPSTPNVKPAPPARVRPAAPVTTAAPPAAATAAADAAATAAAAAGPIHHHHSTVPIPVAPAAPAAVVTAPAAATTSAAPAAGKATAAATPAVPIAAKTVATPATAAAAPVAAKAPAAPAAPAKTVPAPVAPAAALPKTAAVTPAAPAANGAAAAADADANVAVRPATEQGGPRLRGGHKRPNGGGATVAAAGRRTTATKRQQQPLHWHESDSEGSEGEGDRHHRGGPPPPKEGGRPGCGRPRHLTGPRAAPGMLGMHPHDHHEHEGREGEWGRPHDEEPEGPPCEEQEGGPEGGWWAPPPMEQEEDLLYTGALGYGPSADLCMHQHYEQLSQPCAQAIDDLYQVREQFWQSATAPPPPPHHHGVLLLLLGVVLVACGVRRCVRRGKVQKIRTFMNAIRGNAALKATVERETGLAVPEPVCPQHQQPCKKSWRCRLACAVTLVLSFLLAVDITGHVLHHMDERAAEQGEEPACPGKAIGILIGVFVVELLALFALIKTGKWVKRTFFAASSSAVTVEPSAPVFTGDGYAPLPQGDDIDHMPATEMTTMRPITSTTTKMVMPSGAVVLVPVSAAPVSSVRMV